MNLGSGAGGRGGRGGNLIPNSSSSSSSSSVIRSDNSTSRNLPQPIQTGSGSGRSNIDTGNSIPLRPRTSGAHPKESIFDSTKRLIDTVFIQKQEILLENIAQKQSYYDTHGLLVVREDCKEVKGKYLKKM